MRNKCTHKNRPLAKIEFLSEAELWWREILVSGLVLSCWYDAQWFMLELVHYLMILRPDRPLPCRNNFIMDSPGLSSTLPQTQCNITFQPALIILHCTVTVTPTPHSHDTSGEIQRDKKFFSFIERVVSDNGHNVLNKSYWVASRKYCH